jgi:hypothetical protein
MPRAQSFEPAGTNRNSSRRQADAAIRLGRYVTTFRAVDQSVLWWVDGRIIPHFEVRVVLSLTYRAGGYPYDTVTGVKREGHSGFSRQRQPSMDLGMRTRVPRIPGAVTNTSAPTRPCHTRRYSQLPAVKFLRPVATRYSRGFPEGS